MIMIMMMMKFMEAHGVQKVLLNNVRYNKRNYVSNNVTKKKLRSFSMRCQEQTKEKLLLLLCLFNDNKSSTYVMYCHTRNDTIILNVDTESIWEESAVVCCR